MTLIDVEVRTFHLYAAMNGETRRESARRGYGCFFGETDFTKSAEKHALRQGAFA